MSDRITLSSEKPSFLLPRRDPMIIAMLDSCRPVELASEMKNSICDGADAICVEIGKLEKEFHSGEYYRQIFSYAEDCPVYVTNYRDNFNSGLTDDALAAGLLEALDCGATLCDVMGDMYSPDPLELTKNPSAVSKQKELICEIHRRGGEVIMSSHVKRHLCQNDVIDFALSQEARGVDIVKLVTVADTMEQLMENLNASLLLQKRLSIPFIFVANGQYGKIQRNIGYMFGSFALLCVYRYRTPRIFSQPLIKSMKSVLQNVDWKPDRILKEAIGGLH